MGGLPFTVDAQETGQSNGLSGGIMPCIILLSQVYNSPCGEGKGWGLLFHLSEGPIEPRRERFDIGCLHGGAAPDAQTRRRGAIAADVESDIFLFQKTCDLRGSFSLRLLGQSSEPRIDDLETRAGVAACLGIGRE